MNMPKSYTQLQKENAERYQRLFDFFYDEHGLILLEGDMDDIIHEVQDHVKREKGRCRIKQKSEKLKTK